MEQLSIDLDGLAAPPPAPAAARALTPEQLEAVRRRSEPILLSAAAGSGKTAVLVERFVQAVCDDEVAPAAVLAITFTDRAAGELRSRVRARLLELGRREAARDTEAAFVSTFHGFCTRLLRAHPLPAGLDPDFRILDAGTARRLMLNAFELALADFLAGGEQGPVDLLAAYGVDSVRETIEQLHAELRSRGERRPRLPLRSPAAGGEREEADALAAVGLFDRLLGLFGEHYESLKRARLSVDFDDLELIAGELLTSNAALRQSWAEGFALLMVDEFQDTNARQLAILRALDRGNLFTVGDELQSIYGFRHADVALFTERRQQLSGSGALVLTSNFRSRPEILAAVNTVFAKRFEGFAGLRHARPEDAPAPGRPQPAVELLLTSPDEGWKEDALAERIGGGLPYAPAPRQAEARLLAQRVRELVEAGEAEPGEIVLLLRASGDIETFERALQLQGLRTLATVGTFWGRQQIADLHGYLRALANPRDEEALYGTLASPIAGCSRDGLALLAARHGAEGRTVWETLLAVCEEGGGELSEADAAVLTRFCEWFPAEREQAGGRGIPQLLERAIERSRYVPRVLALEWPERRLANIHKLLRLARSFEAQEGRDLRGFVDHVEQLKRSAAKEPEAPVEGVEPDTVRLMTVHAAKGLEFPVVCVADLGRRPPNPSDRLFVDGERVGLRLRRPGQGEGIKALEFEQLREEQRRREREEEDRVFYVAMTRARERLLLSGVGDFTAWPEDKEGCPPVVWLAPALCPELAELGARGPGVSTLRAGADRPEVRVTLSDPASYGSVLRDPPVLVRAPGGPAPELARRAPAPAGAAEDRAGRGPVLPASLSYTSLSLLERCGYRYYLERVLRMPEERPARARGRAGGLAPRDRGTLVHRLLETHEAVSAGAPDAPRVAAVAAELGLAAETGECEEIAGMLARALRGAFAERLAAAPRRRVEIPFAFGLGEGAPLVAGVIDVLCEERDGNVLVVDYKSDRVEPGTDPEALVARDYAVQRLLYALAALREGALVVEVAHWFLELPGEPASATHTAADQAELEAELARRLARAWAEPYSVSERPHLGLCLTCPGRGGLCSWDREMTDRELTPEAS